MAAHATEHMRIGFRAGISIGSKALERGCEISHDAHSREPHRSGCMRPKNFARSTLLICFLIGLSLVMRLSAVAATNIVSDGNWRVTSPAAPARWNTLPGFDDSDAAGWEYAFKAPSGNTIWMRSNQSASSPGQVWFRHRFILPAQPTSASGTVN